MAKQTHFANGQHQDGSQQKDEKLDVQPQPGILIGLLIEHHTAKGGDQKENVGGIKPGVENPQEPGLLCLGLFGEGHTDGGQAEDQHGGRAELEKSCPGIGAVAYPFGQSRTAKEKQALDDAKDEK